VVAKVFVFFRKRQFYFGISQYR